MSLGWTLTGDGSGGDKPTEGKAECHFRVYAFLGALRSW